MKLKKLKNPLLRRRFDHYFSFSKPFLNIHNFFLGLIYLIYLTYFVSLIVMGIKYDAKYFLNKGHFNIYQLLILLFLLVTSFFSGLMIMIMKLQIKGKFYLFLLTLGLKKVDIFADRFWGHVGNMILITMPIVIFGFMVGPNKWFVLILFVALYLFGFFLYSLRLLILHLIKDVDHVELIESIILLIIFTGSFVYFPTELIKKSSHGIKYFQYFSPVGGLMLSINHLDSLFLQPYLYLYLPLILSTIGIFHKAKKTLK